MWNREKKSQDLRFWSKQEIKNSPFHLSGGDIIIVLTTALALVIDFVVTISRYDQVFAPTKVIMLILITAGAVMVMDIPPALIGKAFAKFSNTENGKVKSVAVVSGGIFLVVGITVLNLWLTYELRSVMFEDPVSASLGIFAEETLSSKTPEIAAVITGLIPFATSVTCFIVSLLFTEALEKTDKKKLDKEIQALEQNIAKLESDFIHGCTKYPGAERIMGMLMEDKNDSEIISSLLEKHSQAQSLAMEVDLLSRKIDYIWSCENQIVQGFLEALADQVEDEEFRKEIMILAKEFRSGMEDSKEEIQYRMVKQILNEDVAIRLKKSPQLLLQEVAINA